MQPQSLGLLADRASGYAAPNAPIFLAHPANRAFVEGRASRIGSRTVMLILAAIVVVAAIGIGYEAARRLSFYDVVLKTGTPAEAVITHTRTASGSRANTSYFITFTYSAKDRTFEHEQEIGRELYERIDTGSVITVAYLADDPAFVVLTGAYADTTERNRALVFVLVTGGIALIICGMLYNIDTKNRRLSAQGVFLNGMLVNANGKRGRLGAYNVTLTYAFITPRGAHVQDKIIVNRRDLVGNVPTIGTPVTVRYVNDKLYRLL